MTRTMMIDSSFLEAQIGVNGIRDKRPNYAGYKG